MGETDSLYPHHHYSTDNEYDDMSGVYEPICLGLTDNHWQNI
ncbi:hypothetical protein SAMN06266787_10934 [Halorubrum ezzemoulense]|uniref:Uncharacterized protein n=1 Tax=Halorubrum ezzemoulense TaxID=337243 RepID=A0A238Y810_HALEZ|nr:hypothetical protein SAMN06266787_10934 [Halorubrum ezzemoulense]